MDHTIALIHHLEMFGELSADDKKIIAEFTYLKNIEARSSFIKVGEIAHKIGFLNFGICRYFFYDGEGNEITSFFMMEDHFVTNLVSFNELTPSSGTILTETECTMLIIERKAWETFSKEIPQWNSIITKISSKILLEKTNFQRLIIQEDAKKAYIHFSKNYPSIVQRVSQKHIASFLGITKFSLSRIRKELARSEH